MSSLQLNGDTSGSVTLAVPAVAGTNTITLPAATGTVLTTASVVTEAQGGTGTTTGYYGFKNRLINGAMGIWQRGTSFSVSGANYYWADRWTNASNGYTATRSTDVPTGMAQYSVDITTTGANLGSIVQRIEAANCADLPGQNVTVSFYIKAVSGGGSNGVNVRLDYANSADNFSATTAISQVQLATTLSSSWVKYTYTWTNLPSGAANGLMLYIFADNVTATDCRYTLVQLEKGSTATSFDYRPYGTELMLCQRYYQLNTAASGYANTTTSVNIVISGESSMRASPSVSVFNTTNVILDYNVAYRNISAVALGSFQTTNGVEVNITSATTTANKPQALSPNAIALSAEL